MEIGIMVQREKRRIAKQLVERFLACEITNDDFEDAFPSGDDDPALDAIHDNLWPYYDERHSHKLEGKHEPAQETRDLFERCAAFLGSDLEYEWPPHEWISLKYGVLRFLGLGKWIDAKFERFKHHGDFDVWPFIRNEDYLRWRPVRSD